MLGFGVLLNVLNLVSNVGFGKVHVMLCQALSPIILNPCVFQRKFYPHVLIYLPLNHQNVILKKLLFDVLKAP